MQVKDRVSLGFTKLAPDYQSVSSDSTPEDKGRHGEVFLSHILVPTNKQAPWNNKGAAIRQRMLNSISMLPVRWRSVLPRCWKLRFLLPAPRVNCMCVLVAVKVAEPGQHWILTPGTGWWELLNVALLMWNSALEDLFSVLWLYMEKCCI